MEKTKSQAAIESKIDEIAGNYENFGDDWETNDVFYTRLDEWKINKTLTQFASFVQDEARNQIDVLRDKYQSEIPTEHWGIYSFSQYLKDNI